MGDVIDLATRAATDHRHGLPLAVARHLRARIQDIDTLTAGNADVAEMVACCTDLHHLAPLLDQYIATGSGLEPDDPLTREIETGISWAQNAVLYYLADAKRGAK